MGNHFIKSLILLSCIFLTMNMVNAQTNPNGWDQGLSYAESHKNDAENAIKKSDPTTIPGYESNPDQTSYYNGVTQDNTDQMENDAYSQANQTEAGEAIINSFNQHDIVTIDTNSKNFQNSQAIENNPTNYIDNNQFCMDGHCTDQSYTQSGSFNNAMSALNADADAESYENPTSIFKGNGEFCHKSVAGYNDCCKDSGWGQDINLAHCSEEEKELGVSKEKGVAVYVGEYCSHKTFLGVCTEHKKSYCVFQSTTSYIMQTQGRHDQLGIGFGSSKHPDCRGLTADELSRIDQSKIDWSAFYQTELNPNQPDMGVDQARIEQEVAGL